MKIKRREIEARYAANYDLWYRRERFIVEM
jgi:hypothetical protein